MTFGHRLKQAREAKKLTQDQLGKGLGTDGKDCTKAVVSGWEQDKHHPRADQLALVCNRLDVTADYLLFGKVDAANLPADVRTVVDGISGLVGFQREWFMIAATESIVVAKELPAIKGSKNQDVIAQEAPPKRDRAA